MRYWNFTYYDVGVALF